MAQTTQATKKMKISFVVMILHVLLVAKVF